MGEFFKGWRRKLGLLILILASVFMAGWFRSQLYLDKCEIIGRAAMVSIASVQHQLYLEKRGVLFEWPKRYTLPRVNMMSLRIPKPGVSTVKTDLNIRHLDNNDEINWQFDLVGFHFSSGKSTTTEWARAVIPYWSIFIPLTVFSAFLLMPKQYKLNLVKATDVMAKDGAK